jgi:hypothetical protein
MIVYSILVRPHVKWYASTHFAHGSDKLASTTHGDSLLQPPHWGSKLASIVIGNLKPI